jgi:hypothetical protein
MGKGFHAGEEYERPKIYEIDQIAKFQMWLALEVIEQGEFPDSQEVYKVMRMFFAHLLTWDRELQAPLREQIAREIEEQLQKIGYDRNGKEIDEGTKYPEYDDGWCSALDEAIAIVRERDETT